MNSSFNPAAEFLGEAPPQKFPWWNVGLFVGTCFSTLLIGAIQMAGFNGQDVDVAVSRFWQEPSTLLIGLPFCLAIMSILFAHEMGHYLACRYYGIDASLPYFIPFPSLVGTMGAFIRIRSPFPDRGSLLEVGIAGPIAGFIVAVGALVFSMGQSRFVVPETLEGAITLGDPLVLKATQYLMGMTPPPGMDTYMHPICFAAWFGFLATALNLLPAAQLDGGHVTYALFARYHKRVSQAVIALLVPLAIFYWAGWWLWIILLLVLRLQHPSTLDDFEPLRRRHIVLGWIGLAMLILCFTPAPFSL
jgi:membrane-associated protease RseP (regulator of RpoE activity)